MTVEYGLYFHVNFILLYMSLYFHVNFQIMYMMRLAGLHLPSHSVVLMQVAHTFPITRTHPLNRSYGPFDLSKPHSPQRMGLCRLQSFHISG